MAHFCARGKRLSRSAVAFFAQVLLEVLDSECAHP
jgi:hypothetical protein